MDFNTLSNLDQNGPNPLKKHFRQPKLYITLPSSGKFYPDGSLIVSENGEYPVFAMTAKDELSMKTPDALLNGQATVDMIQSCVPNIKNAWDMPSIDMDAVLIAIRIATYGEMLDITTKIPNIGVEKDYQANLREILGSIMASKFSDTINVNNMLFKIRPLSYREFTESSTKTFEEQRIFKVINDQSIPEGEKLKKFNESFLKLTSITVNSVFQSVYSITVDETEVTNKTHIFEFLTNSEKKVFDAIHTHLKDQKEKFQIKPMKVFTTEDEIQEGAPETFDVPVTFDQSNFFA